MRPNRRRCDVRMPKWLYEELTEMAMLRGWNFTEMLMMAAEKGLNWYQKDWRTRHPNEKAPDEGAGEKRCPNDIPQKKNKPLTPEESKKLDKEIDDLLDKIYGKDAKKKK